MSSNENLVLATVIENGSSSVLSALVSKRSKDNNPIDSISDATVDVIAVSASGTFSMDHPGGTSGNSGNYW